MGPRCPGFPLKKKQAGAELGQAQLKLRFDLTLFFFENLLSLYPALEWKKIMQWSPLWIIFKGKIEIAHLLQEQSVHQDDHFLQT